MLYSASIADIWPTIEAKVRATLTDPDEAGPDDLYAACEAGEAFPLTDGNDVLIFRIAINPHNGERQLILWWASTDVFGAFERLEPEISKMAKALSAKNLLARPSATFYSTRVGWLRKATKMGWTLKNVEFSKEFA